MSGDRDPAPFRYVPPKRRRWHEDLSWWMVLDPKRLLDWLFTLLLARLPNDLTRLGVCTLAGFAVGFGLGLFGDDGWRDGLIGGGLIGTLAAVGFSVIWTRRRHREQGGGRLARLLLTFALCVLAALVVIGVMYARGG